MAEIENKLIKQLEDILPSKIVIPNEIKLLYKWIEDNHLYWDDTKSGSRIGFLFPYDKLEDSFSDSGRIGGTTIDFYAEDQSMLKYWFGHESEEIKSRLVTFAKSGKDGSLCALWLDDTGKTKIVHMGSGSGSSLCCVLTDNGIDFLRLLAIGYDEICWDEYFDKKPSDITDFRVEPNIKFQDWIKSTFKVEIPQTASEIVKTTASMNDESSLDPFHTWCNLNSR